MTNPAPSVTVPSVRTLLDAAEETELAVRIEAGALAAAALRGERPAGDATADELVVLTRLGSEAFGRYVEANLALVGLVLRQEFAQRRGDVDLFQDGCLGLIEAVRRFDHRRGCRFATYALYWIRAALRAADSRPDCASGLSGAAARQRRRVRGIATRLSQEHRREPTVDELAAALGRSVAWTGRLLSHRPVAALSEVGAAQAADPGAQRALEAVLAGPAPGAELLDEVDPLTRRILGLRYGFDDTSSTGSGGASARSATQVARLLGLTVRQVRQIEADGLEELRGACPQHARSHLAG